MCNEKGYVNDREGNLKRMYILKTVEVIRYLVTAGLAVLSIYKVYQIRQAKERNPQNYAEVRLLLIEWWLSIIWLTLLVHKNISLFITICTG